MAKNNFKKPVNDGQELIIEESNKKIIVIAILSIFVVIGLIIASIYYFNHRDEEKDLNKNNDKRDEVIKEPVIEEPVIEPEEEKEEVKPSVSVNTGVNNNTVIETPIAPVVPDVEPARTPTSFVSTTEDISLVTEENVVKVTGTSSYVMKVNEAFGEGYNNIIKIKVILDSDYSLEDLDNLIITTKTVNGYNNYGKEALDSAAEEIEAGKLYFYWMQAVGDGMNKTPEITINYGDGNIETYTLDLTDLNLLSILDETLASTLVVIPEDNEVIGGQELTYEMIILEEKPSEEVVWKEDTSNENTPETEEVNSTIPNDQVDNLETTEEEIINIEEEKEVVTEPETINYTLKFTGEANYYENGVMARLGLGEYNYVLAVKVLAPADITLEELEGLELMVSKPNGETATYTGVDVLDNLEIGNYYIYLYQAIDEGAVNPYFIIDFDGEGTKYGDIIYKFDISELEKTTPSLEDDSPEEEDNLTGESDTSNLENNTEINTLNEDVIEESPSITTTSVTSVIELITSA